MEESKNALQQWKTESVVEQRYTKTKKLQYLIKMQKIVFCRFSTRFANFYAQEWISVEKLVCLSVFQTSDTTLLKCISNEW